jgi:hypothetical protein
MKKIVFAGAFALAAMGAQADVGGFFGVTYAFGSKGGIGLTLQATSSRHENRGVAAAGVSYYPFASGSKFGIPLGVGYQGKNSGGIVSYDFVLDAPAVSAGYVNTHGDSQPAPIPLTE